MLSCGIKIQELFVQCSYNMYIIFSSHKGKKEQFLWSEYQTPVLRIRALI